MQLIPGSSIREQFPIFSRHGRPALAFLDTAASSQKPSVVLNRLHGFLAYEHANIHRGAYSLSGDATRNYEEARSRIAAFVGAPSAASIIFTKGATEAINLVAYSSRCFFETGDAVMVSLLEHHSNFVPWQLLAKKNGLQVIFTGIKSNASIDIDAVCRQLKQGKPRLLAITMLSNAFGSVIPVKQLIEVAHDNGCLVLLDAAQAAAHIRLDVKDLDCDFLVFSGHKVYGPTGIGVLYGKQELLNQMEVFESGGGMIQSVTKEETTFAEAPYKFEAGTPPIAEAIALGTAVEFLQQIGLDKVADHETRLLGRAVELLAAEDQVTIYGPGLQNNQQASIVSFNVAGVHPHDLATFADSFNVQIRAGHHCAMPALKELGLHSTARASLGVYSTEDDLLSLLEAIRQAKRVLR